MRALVDPAFGPKRREMVKDIFKSCCSDLGLTKADDFTILFQSKFQQHNVGGSTNHRVMHTPEPTILVQINPHQPDGHFGLVVCHEMVHVKQIIKDGLSAKWGGVYWQKKRYGVFKLAFLKWKDWALKQTPWEIEAYSRDWLLYNRAVDFCFRDHPEDKPRYLPPRDKDFNFPKKDLKEIFVGDVNAAEIAKLLDGLMAAVKANEAAKPTA